jgi:hypothetical protein
MGEDDIFAEWNTTFSLTKRAPNGPQTFTDGYGEFSGI